MGSRKKVIPEAVKEVKAEVEGWRGEFVEVKAGELAEVLGGGGAEVEVWEAGGGRLKVKVPGREGLDVAAVVRAFRGEGPCELPPTMQSSA